MIDKRVFNRVSQELFLEFCKTLKGKKFAYPPLLNLTPEELYPQLLEQYLFSVLYRAFYLSFLEENRERLRHMEAALDTLETHLNRLKREGNALRQEEITEEIEVILLGIVGKSEGMAPVSSPPR